MMVRDEDDGVRNSFGIEAFFLGGMALLVFGIALFAAMNTSFGGGFGNNNGANGGSSSTTGTTTITSSASTITTTADNRDVICACYNGGFDTAGKTSDVQSTTYRTGFSQCRALGSIEGGDAWTAGWDARRSGRSYEATCKAYKRRR